MNKYYGPSSYTFLVTDFHPNDSLNSSLEVLEVQPQDKRPLNKQINNIRTESKYLGIR